MMTALNSLVHQKWLWGRRKKRREVEEREDRTPKGNSDARRGRSHWSNLVRGVGYEEQEKTWKVEWGARD